MNPITFALATSTSSGTSLYSSLPYLILIVVIVLIRLFRYSTGRRFSLRRVFTLPAMFALITILSLITIPINYYIYFVVLLAAGILPGVRWGEGATLYYANDQLMYKRSVIILALWGASLVGRLAIEFLFPGNLDAVLIVQGLLSFETGMIIGESDRLYRKYRAIASA